MATTEPPIYDDRPRTDAWPARFGETAFEFYDRVDQPFHAEVRRLTNDWFSRFPEGVDKHDLACRLRSDDIRHVSAFWELWIHEFLLRIGATVTIHPDCPDGRRRDFRVEREGEAFYLEANCFFDPPAEQSRQMRLAEFTAQLTRRLDLPRHLPGVIVFEVGTRSLSTKQIAREMMEAAASVAPVDGIRRLARRKTEDGWDLMPTLQAIPADSDPVLVTELMCGDSGKGSYAEAHIKPLRKAIKNKAAQASRLDLPYVVAINFCQRFGQRLQPMDLHQALVGTETTVLGHDMQVAFTRHNPDGAFSSGHGVRTTSISGLILGIGIGPGCAGSALPDWHAHPAPDRPLAQRLPLATVAHSPDPSVEPVRFDGPLTAEAAFGLSDPWPGVEPFSNPYWLTARTMKAR